MTNIHHTRNNIFSILEKKSSKIVEKLEVELEKVNLELFWVWLIIGLAGDALSAYLPHRTQDNSFFLGRPNRNMDSQECRHAELQHHTSWISRKCCWMLVNVPALCAQPTSCDEMVTEPAGCNGRTCQWQPSPGRLAAANQPILTIEITVQSLSSTVAASLPHSSHYLCCTRGSAAEILKVFPANSLVGVTLCSPPWNAYLSATVQERPEGLRIMTKICKSAQVWVWA